MRKRDLAPPALLLAALVVLSAPAWSTLLPPPPGGAGTVNDVTENAFQHPFEGASRELRRSFFVGNSFFRDVWVAAPSSTSGRDGLGPVFNAVSCSGCHSLDGRGVAITADGKVDISLLFRLSHFDGKQMVGDPEYGGQFNPLSLEGVESEGQVFADFSPLPGAFADGTAYALRSPTYRFALLQFGTMRETTRVSPRQAPQLVGVGLLEAIREEDILARVDEKDADGDGISGRANFIFDRAHRKMALGRFGWKANQPSLLQQNAGAFQGDLGVTSSLFPDEPCTEKQENCVKSPNGGTPELSDQILSRVTTYTQLLAVPNRRIDNPALVERGEGKFTEIGCAKCHTPSFTTGDTHELEILRHQLIFPYTDMLLHDMGMALADHSPDGKANGREWKTPPLWGIGLLPTVSKHQNLMHDGRARGVEEAILWHGGESSASREQYKQLSAQDRAALLVFVNSL